MSPRDTWPQVVRHPATWVLVVIVALAAVLRARGLAFGLPAVYNPDEVAIMTRALAFGTGDLNPHNFLYPTFYFYVLFGWVGAAFVWARATGAVASLQAFQNEFFTDPSFIYLAGRWFSVLCGTATVVLVYRLADRVWNRPVALAAALYLATSPFAVRDAHYVKHDVPATLAVVVAYLAMLAFVNGPAAREAGRQPARLAAVAGLAAGVAFSTHYYTVFLALPLAWVIVSGPGSWRARMRVLLVAGVVSAVTFFALSPYLPLEWRTALADMTANRRIVVDRASEHGGWVSGLSAYGWMLWRDALGRPITLLAAIGLVHVARTHARVAVWWLAFPLPFFAFIAHTVPATRYLNPILPFVAVLAAVGAHSIVARAVSAPPARLAVLGFLALLTSGAGIQASWRTGTFFNQDDTRTQALRWVEANIPAGASIALQPYSVPVTQSRDSLIESLRHRLGDERAASPKFAIRLRLDPYPTPAYRTIFLGGGGLDADKIYVDYTELGGVHGLDALRVRQVTWVVVKRYNVATPDTVPFLETLGRDGQRVAVFSPIRGEADDGSVVEPYLHNLDARIVPALERPGPVVEIWRLADLDTPGR